MKCSKLFLQLKTMYIILILYKTTHTSCSLFFHILSFSILFHRHSLSQQKSNDESSRASRKINGTNNNNTNTATAIVSNGQQYVNSNGACNNGMRRDSPTPQSPQISLSSGSDSNLSRGRHNFSSTGNEIGGGREISIRKSTLLRRIWSKELRQHDARSGSWSPPLRRTHRKLHISGTSFESTLIPNERECLECKKLDEEYSSEALPKRLRLTKTIKLDSSSASSQQQSEFIDTPQTITEPDDEINQNKFIFPITATTTTTATTTESTPCRFKPNFDTPQDSVRVEAESQQDNSDVTSDSGNHEQSRSETDENISVSTTICQDIKKHQNGEDKLIANLLIDSLNNVIESEVSENNNNNNNVNEQLSTVDVSASAYSSNSVHCVNNSFSNNNNSNNIKLNRRTSKNNTVDINDNLGDEQFSNNLKSSVNVSKSKIVFDYSQVPSVYLTNELLTDLIVNGNQSHAKARHFLYGGLTQEQVNYTVSILFLV